MFTVYYGLDNIIHVVCLQCTMAWIIWYTRYVYMQCTRGMFTVFHGLDNMIHVVCSQCVLVSSYSRVRCNTNNYTSFVTDMLCEFSHNWLKHAMYRIILSCYCYGTQKNVNSSRNPDCFWWCYIQNESRYRFLYSYRELDVIEIVMRVVMDTRALGNKNTCES